ncbi:hypothetical protein [Streptomyces hoynatensis]|uniref:Uncharacterized protein n=1 Tax=Streptomyces hoynatensis TaxID=1141874 RepID=A0A3A9Z4L4_9ACTN|nr:hypothetical protein [Streptomyces hoynatensis]RKN42316.1 hypothetical protein D7294_12820 [Streptomyces hoynatensis]
MDARMVEKAAFLLREAHVSRQEAVHALLEYFPGTAFEDRLRCVHEAYDIVHLGAVPTYSVSSQVSDARYFAAAHERHAFGY